MTYITRITKNTSSTSATTGAFIVDGGSGFGGAVNLGDSVTVAGIISLLNGTASTNTTTGALAIPYGGVGIGGALNVGGTSTLTDLIASTISGSVIATEAQVDAGSATDVVITPATLSYALVKNTPDLSSPGPIGNTTPNTGAFTDLTASTLNGDVVAVNADLDLSSSSANDLVISPLGLYNVLANGPPVIGNTVQNDAKFKEVQATSLSGPLFATMSDIKSTGSSTSLIVTPDAISDFFQSPSFALGAVSPGDVYASNVDFSTISGSVLSNTTTDLTDAVNNKLITPSVLQSALTAPYPIGSVTRNTGAFSTLSWNTINASNIAAQSDLTTGTSTNLFINPSALKTHLASPNPIGTSNANTGTFTTLTGSIIYGALGSSDTRGNIYGDNLDVNTLSGSVIPANSTELATGLNTQIVTPYWLLQSFASPPSTIGDGTTDSKFDNVQAATISGDVIATTSDIDTGTSSSKVITPSTLTYAIQNSSSILLGSPDSIGDITPNSGAFTTLSATGAFTAESTADITGNTTVGGTLGVTGALTASSTAAITGNTTVGGTLGVTGATTLSSMGMSGVLSVTNNTASSSTITGCGVFGGGIGVAGNVNVGGNVNTSGNMLYSGFICRGKRTPITGSYTILESDYIIAVKVNTAVTITLPEISTLTRKDKIYIIKAEITNSNILVVTSGSDTIDGQISIAVNGSYNSLSLYSDETNSWYIY
jgi:hypothetical protein